MEEFFKKNLRIIALVCLFFVGFSAAYFFHNLRPTGAGEAGVVIRKGESLDKIAAELKRKNLIRSEFVFKFYAALTLSAHLLKHGFYEFTGEMSVPEIIRALVAGRADEMTVIIPEGSTIRDIDAILSEKGIVRKGEIIAYATASDQKLEGFLFPDTYRFFLETPAADIVRRLRETFDKKALPKILLHGPDYYRTLIMASLLEKEIPDSKERRVAAGIFEKRLKSGWPLQADASICYIKPGKCYPLTALDLKIDSPYNTYLYKGLPPTPIANPGLDAIEAALEPESSPFWFYLSNPRNQKTIFAKTLDEHSENRALYLR